jgi:hypothetical protein
MKEVGPGRWSRIHKELEAKNLLVRCYTHDCSCCLLTATSADLDGIVDSGLEDGLASWRKPVIPKCEDS